MTTRQRIIVIVGIILTLGITSLIAVAIVQSKEKMKPPTPTKNVRKVESAIVEYSNVSTMISGTGRVLSQNSIDIISEVQGKLLEGDIPLKKGASFKKGQLLAHIYDTDANYSMKSRKSSFLNALANILPDVKIDYPDSYQKWIAFFESVDITKPLPELPELSTNQEKIFLAGRGILRDYYSIKADEERLKKYYLWAPFSGSVQQVMLEVGSVANPGSRVASIIKTGSLEIEVPLQVNETRWVKYGQIVVLRAENGQNIGKGKVVRKATYVDPNSQSINVYIELLPGSASVYAGQYLTAEFQGMVISQAMEIPRNASFNRNEIFIIDSGYLAKREIDILKTNETSIIFNGLAEGTEIVVQPLANATSNMPVQTEFSNVHKQEIPDADTTELVTEPID